MAAQRMRCRVVEVDDQEICALLARLSRRHVSGGDVIERAAIMAEGADFSAVVAWIDAHDGKPEWALTPSAGGGLHGSRVQLGGAPARGAPLRYVLPPHALT